MIQSNHNVLVSETNTYQTPKTPTNKSDIA